MQHSVSGRGPVKAELAVYFNGPDQDSSRGAYIKINYDPTLGVFWKLLGGTCDTKQIDEERGMVPNETIASIFNGRELPMIKTRTLRVGRYAERGEEGETVVEVIRKIR